MYVCIFHSIQYDLLVCVCAPPPPPPTHTQTPAYVSLTPQIRVAALQNLVKIVSMYYQYMEAYMEPDLLPVSEIAIAHNNFFV